MASKSVRQYNITKAGLMLLILLYAPIAVIGGTAVGRSLGAQSGEIFPFFNWSLFTQVRNPMTRLEIEIIKVGDHTFDPPVSFFELPHIFPRQEIRLLKSAREMLRTYAEQPANAERLREKMEFRYLCIDRPVEYQMSVAIFDPLQRLKEGTLIDKKVVSRNAVGGEVDNSCART